MQILNFNNIIKYKISNKNIKKNFNLNQFKLLILVMDLINFYTLTIIKILEIKNKNKKIK